MAAPTRLSGVEAPEVRPIDTGPSAGSQPAAVTSAFAPTGRWRISSAETRQSGSAMWKVGRDGGADPRQVAGVAAVVAADDDHQVDRPVAAAARRRRPGGPAWRCRWCRTPGSARASASVAVAVAHRGPDHLADRAATRSSASSSGWRGRCAAGRGRDRSRARPRSRTAGRKRVAIAAACGCSRRRAAVSWPIEHDQVAAAVLHRLRGGGLRFLVPDLAVDDRGVAVLGVAAHVLPDVEHRAAGRVDQRAAAAIELLAASRR